jgi:hypothetical protein
VTMEDGKGEAIGSLRPSAILNREPLLNYWSFFGRRISLSTFKRIPGGIASFTV